MAGTVLAVTPGGAFTVRAGGPEAPPEGTRVHEPTSHLRGVVVRVFGPVARPYLSVRPRRAPTPAEGLRLIGSTLLVEPREGP